MKDWEKEINKYIEKIKEEVGYYGEKLLRSQKEAIRKWKEKGVIYIAVVKNDIVRLGATKNTAIPFREDVYVEKPTIIRVCKLL